MTPEKKQELKGLLSEVATESDVMMAIWKTGVVINEIIDSL